LAGSFVEKVRSDPFTFFQRGILIRKLGVIFDYVSSVDLYWES